MNEKNFELAERYVPHGYVQQGKEARKILEKNIRILLEQGKLPSDGWSDLSIKHLLQEIALMDSNNFPENCGVGEREARIASSLVAERHFHLGHGIGRSGDIAEVQPKAAGSSLLNKLTNSFVLDIIKLTGVQSVKGCLTVPVATGMALVLSMLAMKERNPQAKYVIWPRIDQKSCFKSILTAGLEPLIIENLLVGDHLETDLFSIKETIEDKGRENILCIMSTTTCFAPRVPDKLEDIAKICKEFEIPHLINNAYGIQASKCMHLIQQANRVGRVDVFVQSTDKNFMVPVGGAVIAGFDKSLIQAIGKIYPGRASASPIIDVFITLLSLGSNGYKKYLQERKEMYVYLHSNLQKLCGSYGETLLETRQNPISLAITLQTIESKTAGNIKDITEFGSFLFKRSVSGTRVVTPYDEKTIGKYKFAGWGAHHKRYPVSYLTAAAAIGITKSEIDLFLSRLDKAFKTFKKPSSSISNTDSQKSDRVDHPLSNNSLTDPDESNENNKNNFEKVTHDTLDRLDKYDKIPSRYRDRNSHKKQHLIRARSLPKKKSMQITDAQDMNHSFDDSNVMVSSKSDSNLPVDKLSMVADVEYNEIIEQAKRKMLSPTGLPADKMSFLLDI